ncbi:ribosome small subunit-dependent GTPase A [Acidaminobacter sp. JC074]|uniref:ribosome small subunit-dependent GTPase A n=1 Tax=Acidaminobacter sp. JC074 TaxID=2530199 RepID=UPI001F0DA7C3|nr:ribosome small subunit-dependent GTPase A [Acidaminobacter sp. JC074]MCH4890264.1 ribosome small subunit-dependent GTPase A [Acidaminobacter sp. JC074]
MQGIIVKAIAGFYYVKTEDDYFECKARGIFKKRKITPLVGDKVVISKDEADPTKGRIDEILPRTIELVRPPVANVTQAIVVFAVAQPDPNINLLDKLLAICEHRGLSVVLCFNKVDLDQASYVKSLEETYMKAGYKVIPTSATNHIEIEALKEVLKDEISVFAGPSGVGKSSLLNEIQEGIKLEVGGLSKKIARGKHTTRHSELLPLESGGMVVDTPGFTSMDISEIEIEELADCFIEFKDHLNCKFNNCKHLNEPKCGIKEAVDAGDISQSRYDSYVYFMNALEEHRRYKSW